MAIKVCSLLLVLSELVLHFDFVGRFVKFRSFADSLTALTVIVVDAHSLLKDLLGVCMPGLVASLHHAQSILLYFVEEVLFVIKIVVPAVSHFIRELCVLLR